MPTDSTSRTLVILAALAVLAGVAWLVRDILPPFIIALVLALLLDPLMARMQRAGLPRGLAVAFTFLAFLALFAAVLIFMVPRTITQVADLARNVGPYQVKVQEFADLWMRQHAADLRRMHLPESMPDFVRRYQGEILRYVQILLTRVFGALETTASAIGWVIVIPIVTLYLLADMEKLRARLIHVVPPRHREMVRELAGKVGRVFVAYLRGLMLICACYGMAVYVALGLWLALPYALILSLAAAILYSVPYLGQITLIAICASVAWLTGRVPFYIGEVAISLLVIGQCFDQFITPRVIGKQVGLHPVIGLFALMVGAQLCGPIGMVFAVPVAASVRVVLIQLFPRLNEPIPAAESVALDPVLAKEPEPVEVAAMGLYVRVYGYIEFDRYMRDLDPDELASIHEAFQSFKYDEIWPFTNIFSEPHDGYTVVTVSFARSYKWDEDFAKQWLSRFEELLATLPFFSAWAAIEPEAGAGESRHVFYIIDSGMPGDVGSYVRQEYTVQETQLTEERIRLLPSDTNSSTSEAH